MENIRSGLLRVCSPEYQEKEYLQLRSPVAPATFHPGRCRHECLGMGNDRDLFLGGRIFLNRPHGAALQAVGNWLKKYAVDSGELEGEENEVRRNWV